MLFFFGCFLPGCGQQRSVGTLDGSAAVADDETAEHATSPGERAAVGVGFEFLGDAGGQLLASLLPPSEQLPRLPSDLPSGPRQFPTPPALQRAETTWPDNQATPRSPKGAAPRLQRPHDVPEDIPLAGYLGHPMPAERPPLVAGERVRESSPDLNQPLALANLGQKQPETPPADDPTTDSSGAAALAAPPPPRGKPAPFLRLTLPDPYEHRQSVRLRKDWPEDSAPTSSTPHPPGR
jgi:hypothetical protein